MTSIRLQQVVKEYDKQMNNYALFGYWKGAKWIYEYVGHPELTCRCG